MQQSYQIEDGVAMRPQSPLILADRKMAREGVPGTHHVPEVTMYECLEIAAKKHPDKPAIHFYGSTIRSAELLRDARRMAGYLQKTCGVAKGDRVLIFSQNCPQFIVAYCAIFCVGAVFVPVNAMLLEDELRHIVEDSGAVAAFASEELAPRLEPLIGTSPLRRVVVHAYGDALGDDDAGFTIPEWLRPRSAEGAPFPAAVCWHHALSQEHEPSVPVFSMDDLCMLPYTSGTTGAPKACMHTHRTIMSSISGSQLWRRRTAESTVLGTAPLFHLLGLQNSVNGTIFLGGTTVLLPRWDAATATELIERYRVTTWGALPPMLVDFFAQPGIEHRDLSSLAFVGGGGAAMPEGTMKLMQERYGIQYLEGYGLTETAAFLITNPVHRPKQRCLGVPTYGVDARVIDPETLQPLPQGEVGEIVVNGAQVMQGYWNQPEETVRSFIVIDGKRFFRTGDLAAVDEEGYFFMRDRLKRMINASGYKVWPAEVEAVLHTHPAIQEACVIASRDAHRGETVKAVIVLRRSCLATREEELLKWCREHMAAYKAPRIVQIAETLPRTSTGKISWRELQEAEL